MGRSHIEPGLVALAVGLLYRPKELRIQRAVGHFGQV